MNDFDKEPDQDKSKENLTEENSELESSKESLLSNIEKNVSLESISPDDLEIVFMHSADGFTAIGTKETDTVATNNNFFVRKDFDIYDTAAKKEKQEFIIRKNNILFFIKGIGTNTESNAIVSNRSGGVFGIAVENFPIDTSTKQKEKLMELLKGSVSTAINDKLLSSVVLSEHNSLLVRGSIPDQDLVTMKNLIAETVSLYQQQYMDVSPKDKIDSNALKNNFDINKEIAASTIEKEDQSPKDLEIQKMEQQIAELDDLLNFLDSDENTDQETDDTTSVQEDSSKVMDSQQEQASEREPDQILYIQDHEPEKGFKMNKTEQKQEAWHKFVIKQYGDEFELGFAKETQDYIDVLVADRRRILEPYFEITTLKEGDLSAIDKKRNIIEVIEPAKLRTSEDGKFLELVEPGKMNYYRPN